jgi:ABC-type nitrate/sulfonate/bicarbonate transport system substrate-binding protein
VPVRVVMTIADKPLFALMARPGISSVEELKGKLLGVSSFGASTDTYARALLRRYKLVPNQDVKILALGGGTARIAAMETGAIDAALIKAPYNVMLEHSVREKQQAGRRALDHEMVRRGSGTSRRKLRYGGVELVEHRRGKPARNSGCSRRNSHRI